VTYAWEKEVNSDLNDIGKQPKTRVDLLPLSVAIDHQRLVVKPLNLFATSLTNGENIVFDHIEVIRMIAAGRPIKSGHITFIKCFSYDPVCFMRNNSKYQVHDLHLAQNTVIFENDQRVWQKRRFRNTARVCEITDRGKVGCQAENNVAQLFKQLRRRKRKQFTRCSS
jgi:hypothetical protein